MNCLACHQRGDIGGPSADKVGFFGLTAAMDLGDEGHIPPKLTGVGAKLQPTAIEQIVFSDELHVRPWMATRMPRFSKDIIGYLPDTLAKSDPAEADSAPPFSELTARDGQRLVGTKGLGCVNCHSVGGVKSLGMPSVDLSTVHDRIRPGWFHAYLVNPPEKNPGTRMPAFWPNGTVAIKDVAGGAERADRCDLELPLAWPRDAAADRPAAVGRDGADPGRGADHSSHVHGSDRQPIDPGRVP